MKEIEPGDIVSRRSYGGDIFFRVIEIVIDGAGIKHAVLKGLEMRLVADAPLADLDLRQAADILTYRHKSIEANVACLKRIYRRRELERQEKVTRNREGDKELSGDFFEVPGQVLHLDGDAEYMEKCLHAYAQLNVTVQGFAIPEAEQPDVIIKYLREYTPDILVLTGHDGVLKKGADLTSLDSYRNSRYFVQSVKTVRREYCGRDSLVIFAGACQSHYEALLAAGATFASSPQRVLIHAYDPVYVVEKVAFTPISESVSMQDIVNNTITGPQGIGGIESRGCYRMGYPKSPY